MLIGKLPSGLLWSTIYISVQTMRLMLSQLLLLIFDSDYLLLHTTILSTILDSSPKATPGLSEYERDIETL